MTEETRIPASGDLQSVTERLRKAEREMMLKIGGLIGLMLLCLVLMCFSAFAYFTAETESVANHIATARFDLKITVTCEGNTINTGTRSGFTTSLQLQGGKPYKITLEPAQTTTATTGFCVITDGGNAWVTDQMNVGETAANKDRDSLTFTLEADKDTTVYLTSHWGTSSAFGYANPDLLVGANAVISYAVTEGTPDQSVTVEPQAPNAAFTPELSITYGEEEKLSSVIPVVSAPYTTFNIDAGTTYTVSAEPLPYDAQDEGFFLLRAKGCDTVFYTATLHKKQAVDSVEVPGLSFSVKANTETEITLEFRLGTPAASGYSAAENYISNGNACEFLLPLPTPTPEVTPEVTPEATPEITPEITPEVTPEATPEATPVVTPEPTPTPGI